MRTRTDARIGRKLIILTALACALLAAACDGDITRREVLADLTDRVIIPRFEAAASWSAALEASAAALAAQPGGGNLEAARDAWRSARAAWSRTEASWFGPAMDRRSESLIAYWLSKPNDPANQYPEPIRRRLSDDGAIDAATVVDIFASTERGLHAVEYLLFEPRDWILAQLADPASRYAPYLLALTAVIADETAALRDDWRGEYGDQFAGRGGRAIAESLGLTELVRVSVFLTETVADMQIGAAIAARGGEPDPEAIPGGAGRHALEDIRQRLLGIQELYLGAPDGLGVSDLIAALSEQTDQRMCDAFAAAQTALDDLQAPLKQTVADQTAELLAAHAAIVQLQRVMNTELVSLLGISVGFSDNDGDS